MIGIERGKGDFEVIVGEKIIKFREFESVGRELEGRDDDKCWVWVIDCRWRFWGGEVFCFCGGCDWKVILVFIFEEEVEFWVLIVVKKLFVVRKM